MAGTSYRTVSGDPQKPTRIRGGSGSKGNTMAHVEAVHALLDDVVAGRKEYDELMGAVEFVFRKGASDEQYLAIAEGFADFVLYSDDYEPNPHLIQAMFEAAASPNWIDRMRCGNTFAEVFEH